MVGRDYSVVGLHPDVNVTFWQLLKCSWDSKQFSAITEYTHIHTNLSFAQPIRVCITVMFG